MNTVNHIQMEEDQNMEEFTKAVHGGVREIRYHMQEVNDNLLRGKLESDVLEGKVKENVANNKTANSKVSKAAAAMKRNKDSVFLGITILTTAALILTFIIG